MIDLDSGSGAVVDAAAAADIARNALFATAKCRLTLAGN
jgi:hypothetical protein